MLAGSGFCFLCLVAWTQCTVHAWMLGAPLFLNEPMLLATTDETPPIVAVEDGIMGNLEPATDERPQVILPKDFRASTKKKQPFVRGVVFLLDPKKQRNPGDTMVLTVRPIDHQDTVVAGAKIPMSKVSFPFRFSMSEKNILPGKADQTDTDLVIRVTICPQESGPQCSDDESDLKGVGLAKLIRNLPGISDVGPVRAGASIGLGGDT